MTDTIEQRIMRELEAARYAAPETPTDHYHNLGIDKAIAIVRRECRMTEEMVERGALAAANSRRILFNEKPMTLKQLKRDSSWPNWVNETKAALEAVLGGEGE